MEVKFVVKAADTKGKTYYEVRSLVWKWLKAPENASGETYKQILNHEGNTTTQSSSAKSQSKFIFS